MKRQPTGGSNGRRTYRILSEQADITDITRSKPVTDLCTKGAPNGPGENHYFPRIMAHYLANECFLAEGVLLRQANINKIRKIPVIIVHGRYDLASPFTSAAELRGALGVPPPEGSSDSFPVPGAGHSPCEPEITRLLVEATDQVVDL